MLSFSSFFQGIKLQPLTPSGSSVDSGAEMMLEKARNAYSVGKMRSTQSPSSSSASLRKEDRKIYLELVKRFNDPKQIDS